MGKVEISPLAVLDLEEIYAFTYDTWGRQQADKYLDMLDVAFLKILKQPHMGSPYLSERIEYRKISIGKHVIFYRSSNAGIVVIRVLHQQMDVDGHL